MKKIKNVLYFYRILGWKEKMTGLGAIGYTFLGYALSGRFKFLSYFLNTFVVFLGTLFAFSVNNFYDWKVQGEKNFLGEKIESGKISENKALFFCFLPFLFGLFLSFLSFFLGLIPTFSFFLLVSLFLLTFFYAKPPLRLKERRFFGFLAVPLGSFLIFLESYFIFGRLTLNLIFFVVLFFLFETYLEILHVLDDSLSETEIKKLDQKKALRLLKILPTTSLFTSLCFSFSNPIFLNTFAFSSLRLFSLRNFKLGEVRKIRKNVFSFQTSFYEYFVYGILGLFRLI